MLKSQTYSMNSCREILTKIWLKIHSQKKKQRHHLKGNWCIFGTTMNITISHALTKRVLKFQAPAMNSCWKNATYFFVTERQTDIQKYGHDG